LDADVFRLTNASWQIQPIEQGAGDLDRGTGSVEFSRSKAPLDAGDHSLCPTLIALVAVIPLGTAFRSI
jgi:hypothetical protein